ncbi:uncharacterized protein F4807DRAFT_43847 [Annulohypoxylon truncatum]|uniref:uncharacterized protein n=1 Tax=Annulohypoxylon truncatum TaxID=327061 RepID=UPI002008AC4B|nr:uncharacterized protein F4807DRAFT_43847 [Annulohypoxylon truncatum]KAI1210925.1 hypothetical protein F4807DRAFT_43847 [Annulohypoxylon truncatum]
MGKSRRNRAKGGQRPDPIAKPVKPLSDPELIAIREKSILPVIKDLQSTEPKSRTTAARAISNIVQDSKCRKLLLREKIVHIILTETLTDTSLESRAAGWEILRVLVAEEERDFCVHLYRVDIMTAIQHACKNLSHTLTKQDPPFSRSSRAEQLFVWNIAESLTTILPALAEAQDEALDAAVRCQPIVHFLFLLTSLGNTTAPVINSVLSCMITLSEDNQQFAEAILSGSEHIKIYNRLLNIRVGNDYKAVLASAILHNAFSAAQWNDYNPGKDGACDAILVPMLARTLETTRLNMSAADGHGSSNPAEILQVALEVLASIGTTLQETIEKGSRGKKEKKEKSEDNDVAMNGDDEDDEDDEEQLSDHESGDEDDEMDEDEMEADMEMVTGVDGQEDELEGIDDLPTLKELIQRAIPELVKLAQASGGDDEISKYILNHAVTALSNISWTVGCIDFSHKSNTAISRAWTPAAQMIWQDIIAAVLSSDTSDVQLATIVTSLAWAIARTLHGQKFLGGDEHKKFISLYHASKGFDENHDDPFQGLGVKCIGVLGQLALAAPIELNREIGIFLLTVVKGLPETPAADAVEALNQLFDIYGDESNECDKEVFWKDNFLQHLRDTAPKVKAMVKTVDKRQSGELRERAEEANLNLSRFIPYKQKHRP